MIYSNEVIKKYVANDIKIASVASHSALDVFDGAKDEGFSTIAICQKGRETPYVRFRRVVDSVIVLDRFADLVREEIIKKLVDRNAIIVPNRSFSVYVGYDNIERRLEVPVFGNKYLLRWEERFGESNYYRILDEAGIRRPKTYKDPDEIEKPVIVKIPEALRRVERGFFIAVDREDFYRKMNRLIENNIVSKEALNESSIEELVIGAHFNINYFYSIYRGEVELISIDRRIQSNLDGIIRLPADIQLELNETVRFIEVGHEPATIRESILTKLFEIGDRFVEATKRLVPPGIIGPFTLQLMVTPDLDVVVFDVALRIGGGTNIYMGVGSPYSKLYYGEPISMGRRIAMEIRNCIKENCLEGIVT